MPFDPQVNVVHTADGRLIRSTSADDVRRIVAIALTSGAPSGIVVNFHGGLVSAAGALETAADRLYPLYAGQGGAFPIFFVWESGFLEAPLDNLDEISREPIFREFVKKSGEWVLREMQPPALTGARRASTVDSPARFRADVDAWFKTGRARRKLPKRLRHFRKMVSDTIFPTRAAAAPKMVSDTIFQEIHESIRRDAKFQRAVLKPSSIDKEAAAKMFPGRRRKTATVSEWIGVAKAVADIVARVLARVRTGRDHGKYVTIVEEVLRELYIGRIGRAGWWDRMKGDTADAFKPGEEYGGTVFLEALRDALAGAASAPRITLIGHSTGAVYIANFLRAAAQSVPGLTFDVIFETPAATHDFLARTIEEHGSRIANFRLFGMSDERERADVLVPVIYPASLLYFVSGLLEDEPDQPLTGMQRFLDERFDAQRFPNVQVCREFFARYDGALVWSPQDAPSGCASTGRHHQDFDDRDPATLASVARILQGGFPC